MSDIAISVEGIGKLYRIARTASCARGQGSVYQRFTHRARHLFAGTREDAVETLQALSDVSFTVQRGEVVGLIGSNGAGKSTLLKILSRITEPSNGRAVISGRVGSLLEVGTGFHPELTGRENIYLSGAILGMKHAEIDSRFEEIVAFAEVKRFLETPVKRYSSGMYVRLAFAVAAHLQPEVLLVDEILAVGDVSFQKKCLGKMSDVGRQGRTVLFVSHNMVAVQNLCHRVLWLHDGRLVADGSTREVLREYLSTAASGRNARIWDDPAASPGNEKVALRRVSVRPEYGGTGDLVAMSTPLVVEIEYCNLVPGAHLHACIHVVSEQGTAFTTASNETDASTRDQPLPVGVFRSVCRIPGDLLNSGIHNLTVLLRQDGRKAVLRCDDVIGFEVLDLEDRPGMWLGRSPGVVHPKLMWSTAFLGLPGDTHVLDENGTPVVEIAG